MKKQAQSALEEGMRKKKKGGKLAGKIFLGFLVLILVALGAIGLLWRQELISLFSIRQIAGSNDAHLDGAVYEMTISGGYYFEDYLAQGGAASDGELLPFITDHITKGLIPMHIQESNIGCSSFTADDLSTGDRLFGRNYDFSRTNTCIVHTNPGNGRHASVSTVDLQFLGIDKYQGKIGLLDRVLLLAAPYVPLDGVNDAGVACGIYMSYQGQGEGATPTDQQTSRPDLTSTTMLRLILDYAGSVEEAIELIEQYDLHDSANSSFHYMVADAQGNSAILEWVNATDSTDNDGSQRVLQVTYPEAGKNYQVVTNFILAKDYYHQESQEDMHGLDRWTYLNDSLEASHGAVADENAAMALLRDVGRRIWKPDGDAVTVHSVIYNLTDRTATWVGNEHYGEEAYTFQLSATGEKGMTE